MDEQMNRRSGRPNIEFSTLVEVASLASASAAGAADLHAICSMEKQKGSI